MRIIRTKEVKRLQEKKDLVKLPDNGQIIRMRMNWYEGLDKERIDLLMAAKDIVDKVYAYFVNGDSYIFHTKFSPNYYCISRSYLKEEWPQIVKQLDKKIDREGFAA